jgi:branched-chain amino acid transport system substrate-binding protein
MQEVFLRGANMRRALFIAACLTLSITVARADDTVVRIGIATPVTGPIGHLGQDMERGARLAIDELNRLKPVIGGRVVRFEAATEDDRGDPAAATAAAYKLADEKVQGVVGHLNSGPTITAAKVYNDAGIPQVAPIATNPKYTQMGYRNAVRLMATDVQQAEVLSAFVARSFPGGKVAIIDDRTAYGQGLADQIAANLGRMNVTVAMREFTNDKAVDFTAILTSIRGAKVQAVIFAGADAQGGPMARQMRQLGLEAPLVAGDGSCTESWTRLAQGANEGYYCTHAGAPASAMPRLAAFKRQFHERYGSDFLAFAPFGYDAVFVLAESMKNANSTDPRVYGPFLSKVNFQGLTGPIRFDAHGDNPTASVTVYQVRGGKLEQVAQ